MIIADCLRLQQCIAYIELIPSDRQSDWITDLRPPLQEINTQLYIRTDTIHAEIFNVLLKARIWYSLIRFYRKYPEQKTNEKEPNQHSSDLQKHSTFILDLSLIHI